MTNKAFKICERKNCEKTHKMRRDGDIPGIIYGEHLETPIEIKLPFGTLTKLLQQNTFGSIISLDLNGTTLLCVVKDVQRNNYGKLMHVDFQNVSHNDIIKMKIPVDFIGEEALTTKNLHLETFQPVLEFHGSVDKIPELIEFNVSDMNFEDKVFAKDILIPDGVELLTNCDTLLAVVNA
ncbi:MAG: 50S ribosomal protein L25 [Clostridium sp.]|uniref:50S ribosomal protein L25 n=1 Tax=Clostridium sp. TaxID=1506 RepID=UPI003F2CB8B3